MEAAPELVSDPRPTANGEALEPLEAAYEGDVTDGPRRILLLVFGLALLVLVIAGGSVVQASLAASGCGGG